MICLITDASHVASFEAIEGNVQKIDYKLEEFWFEHLRSLRESVRALSKFFSGPPIF